MINEKIKSPNKIRGKNSQRIKNTAPAKIVKTKNIIPTIIVINLTKNPVPREIKLNARYSKNFFKSKPRGRRVISLLQGEARVFKRRGMEKY